MEHFRDGDATQGHTQHRPVVGDRAGRGAARLRLFLRAPQAHRHPALDREGGARRGGRIGAWTAPARAARRARPDLRQVRTAALDAARRRAAGHRRRAARPAGRRAAVPLRAGAGGRRGGARALARAGVPQLRGDADRRGVDRPGPPCDAAERARGGGQGAAAGRAAADRIRSRAALPGGANHQGACPLARLHRRERARGRVRTLDPTGAGLPPGGPPRGHLPAQLRRLRDRAGAEGLLELLGPARADAGVPGRRPARRPRPGDHVARDPPRARAADDGDVDGDDLPPRLLPRRPAPRQHPRPRRRPDRAGRLRPGRQAHGRRHVQADAALHRRRDRERRGAADGAWPSSASAIRRSARRSSPTSCATSSTATTERTSRRSTRSR